MTVEKITAILLAWQIAMRDCEEQMDKFAALAGQVVDSPLGNAVYGVMGGYTREVSDRIGWDAEFLSAWWLEHNFGERPMKIGFPGEELRTIATIDALAAFVAEDLARAGQ